MWEMNRAENVTRFLFPDDSTWGERLRVKRQFYLCGATPRDVLAGRINGDPAASDTLWKLTRGFRASRLIKARIFAYVRKSGKDR